MIKPRADLFDQLLQTREKTTEALERIVNDRLLIQVIRHEHLNEYLAVRESCLFTETEHRIVSHNFSLIDERGVPERLKESSYLNKYGIGKTMTLLGVLSSRDITNSGWRKKDEVVDHFMEPASLSFECNECHVPFKEYTIRFCGFSDPGIQLIEYFNPYLYEYRTGNSTRNA